MADLEKKHDKSIGRKLMAAGVALLAVVFTIMISFFGLLERGTHRFTQETAQTFTDQVSREAETIARLIAFEMSTLDRLFLNWSENLSGDLDLCRQNQWPADAARNDNLIHLLRILWEKVTFNEAINGIELIRNVKKQGRYLTAGYNKKEPAAPCPTRAWKKFSQKSPDDQEPETIDFLMRMSSDSGIDPKAQPGVYELTPSDEQIVEYMPVYAPVAGKGALFLGVVKVDINAQTLKQFLDRRLEHVNTVQRTVIIWVLVGLVLALVIGLALFSYVTRKVTDPILQLARLAEDFSSREDRDLGSLVKDLKNIPITSHDEVWVLREAFVEMTEELNQHIVRLIDGQRLMGLGTLAQGIAHEIFSPLTYVQGNLPILKGHLDALLKLVDQYEKIGNLSEEDAQKILRLKKKMKIEKRIAFIPQLLTDLEEGTDRMFHIVNSLRDFAGFQHEEEPTYDLHAGLESTLNLLRNRFKKGVTVHKEFGDLPPVRCQGRRINQVFLNLLKNAGDAINDHGQIWIKTWVEDQRVAVSITDDGPGVDQESMDKLFQPFFTTKGVEKGTGLGLSISKTIIDDNQGRIRISNEPGPGATFTVELPIGRE